MSQSENINFSHKSSLAKLFKVVAFPVLGEGVEFSSGNSGKISSA